MSENVSEGMSEATSEREPEAGAMSVVILCPHNAAKSVYAAATLHRKAADAGLHLGIATGGVDPDEIVLPIVRERLESQGHVVSDTPKIVSTETLDAADVIVNIGCDHDLLRTSKPISDWEIPNFSDDPEKAFAALDSHVDLLLADLR